MKIWNSYGSEHSANLVMIGKFKDAVSAEKAKTTIDEITEYITRTGEEHHEAERYSDGMMELLHRVRVFDVRPAELEQFIYDVSIEVANNEVVLKTNETDVSAFLKVMIDKGARVEVYSARVSPEPADDR